MATWLWRLFPLLVLLREAVSQTKEQLSQMNDVCSTLPDLSPDLCSETCHNKSCPNTNPCEGLSCTVYPDAVCFFCCCSSDAQWTLNGEQMIRCPIVSSSTTTITTGTGPTATTTVIRGTEGMEPNLALPVPLVAFFEDMLGEHKSDLSDCEGVDIGDSETVDCQEVLRECQRTPWKAECVSCNLDTSG